MSTLIEALVSFFLVAGALFALLGSWGLARLPDFYTRLHGPSKASTLGVGGMLVASMLYFAAHGAPSLHELLDHAVPLHQHPGQRAPADQGGPAPETAVGLPAAC